MSYYPIFLQMKERRCLVIGGGAVGERKVDGLLQSGAAVTVIAPDVTEKLHAWAREERIRHVSRPYRPGDLIGFEVVFAATDDSALNATIYRDAREHRVWLNAADDPAHCDFILPAVIRRGDLAVAVSTGGASPATACAVRDQLGEYLTENVALFVQAAAEARNDLRKRSLRASADEWNNALQGNFRRLIQDGKVEEAKKLLLDTLGAKP